MKTELDRADFHVHLGDRTDEDLIDEAIQNHVNVLAVLDRGMVRIKRLQGLVDYSKSRGVTVLPAIECLTDWEYLDNKVIFELIGMDFNIDHPLIHEHLDPEGPVLQEKNQRRVIHQRRYLEGLGFRLNHSLENMQAWEVINGGQVADTAVRICRIAANDPANDELFNLQSEALEQYLQKRPQDRPQNSQAQEQVSLVRAKYLYWQHFAPEQPGFKKWYPDFTEIIDMIHKADGLVLVAHPKFQHRQGEIKLINIVSRLYQHGVDGVEGWDAGKLDKDVAREAIHFGKLVLGGSGRDKSYYSNRLIGFGDVSQRNMFISPRRLSDIRLYKSTFIVAI